MCSDILNGIKHWLRPLEASMVIDTVIWFNQGMKKDSESLYFLEFQLSKLPPSLNQMLRGHWRTRSAILKSFKNLAIQEITYKHKKPEKPLTNYSIIFTRYTIRPLDLDNLAASFKPILDSLTVTGIIQDDKWGMTDAVFFRQEKVKKKTEQMITIQVREL